MSVNTLLTQLEDSQLIHRLDDLEPAYQFRHALVQETSYASLLIRKRRELHRRVAEAIEQSLPDQLEQNAAILTQHYAEAGDDAKTLIYATLAGDAAARVYANAEALMHYARALEVAKHAPSPSTHGQTEGGARSPLQVLYLKRGRVLELSDRHEAALTNYREMQALGRERGDSATELAALVALGTLLALPTDIADLAQAETLCNTALELTRSLGDRNVEAKVLWNLLLIGYNTGRIAEAIRWGEQSLALAREFNLREQLAYTLNDLSRVYMGAGDMDRARDEQEEARAIWRELGNLPLLAENLANSGFVHFSRAEWEEGLKLNLEALSISRRIGNVWGEAYAQFPLACIYVVRGELDKAVQAMQALIDLGTQVGGIFAVVNGQLLLCWLLAILGQGEQAAALGEQAKVNTTQLFPRMLPMAHAVLALAYLQKGDLDRAGRSVEASLGGLGTQSFDVWFSYFVSVASARLFFAIGDYSRALEVVDKLIQGLRQFGIRVVVSDALDLKARILFQMGETAQAKATLCEARALAESTGERLFLLNILSHLCQFQAECDRQEDGQVLRAEARKLLEEVERNMPPDLLPPFRGLPDVQAVMVE